MTFMEMMASLVIARSQVERLEAALGITAEEAATFLAIATEVRPSSVADLAHRLDCPQSRTSRVVRRLIQLGWVNLVPDGMDRRQFRVRLTGFGCEVLGGTGVGHAASAGRGPASRDAPGPVHLTG